MNVEYGDGRREFLTGLTPEQVAEHTKRITSDPAFESDEVYREKDSSGPYENNRHGRRKWAAEMKRHERKKSKKR